MKLDIDVVSAISQEEASLIERARRALQYVERSFTMTLPSGHRCNDMACAVVWPRQGDLPMRIDFKAVPADGSIGQAYLGPDVPLTEALFDGNSFTQEFLDEIKSAWDDYDDYCKGYSG